MNRLLLGINIDHVATLRQARGTNYPDPVHAAIEVEKSGADFITMHLREDMRHIQIRDIKLIKEIITTKINLEISLSKKILDFSYSLNPEHVCIVPENREEITTEQGLNVIKNFDHISNVIKNFKEIGTNVSLFINPDKQQIHAAKEVGANIIEIHTGFYANANDEYHRNIELNTIKTLSKYANNIGLLVNVGHGLNIYNIEPIASIKEIIGINIGHFVISQSIFHGLLNTICKIKKILLESRRNSYI